MSSATYWLATETSEHSQVLSLENWSQVPVLSYAYHTNWGIKWTSDSAGLLRVVPVRCRCKAGGLFYCWCSVCFPQYSELVGNDFGKEMLAILFACTWRWSYWCNLFRCCFLFSYMTKCIDTSADSGLAFKVGMKKNRITHLKVFIISGPSFHCALAGCQGSGGKAPSAQWQVSGLNISQNTSNVSHFLSSFQTVSS